MRYFFMSIRTAQPTPTLLTLNLWLMKSLRIPALPGYVVSPLKHPTRPFKFGALNKLELTTEILSAAQTDDSSPTERAATNSYVAFNQVYQNLIVIVPPHNVLDETYLALDKLELYVLGSLPLTSSSLELTTLFQSIAIQYVFLTWIQIYLVIWEHKA